MRRRRYKQRFSSRLKELRLWKASRGHGLVLPTQGMLRLSKTWEWIVVKSIGMKFETLL